MIEITLDNLIEEVNRYKPEISNCDTELIKLVYSIMTNQTEKLENISDCTDIIFDNSNTLITGKTYGVDTVKLCDRLTKLGVGTIKGLTPTEEEFLNNADVLDATTETNANKVYHILNLASTTPLYKIIVKKKNSEYTEYLYNVSGATILFGWEGWEYIKTFHVLPAHTYINTIVIDATQKKNTYKKTLLIE